MKGKKWKKTVFDLYLGLTLMGHDKASYRKWNFVKHQILNISQFITWVCQNNSEDVLHTGP